MQQFTDSAGRTAFKDSSGMVFTEGGTRATNYNVNDWNARQLDKYGSGSSSSSSSKSSSKSSSPDYEKIAKTMQKLAIEANKPAIQSLEAGIPEVQQSYQQQRTQLQAEVNPLQERYSNLLNSIKNNQTTAENRQTLVTRNELGKRGITADSTLNQQEVTNAVNPITQDYTGLTKDTGLEQEKAIRNLQNLIANTYTGETDATRAIRNTIAQLQSGAASSGLNTALGMYTAQNQQNNFDVSSDLQKKAQALAERQFNEVTVPQSQYALNKPYYAPTKTPTLADIFG